MFKLGIGKKKKIGVILVALFTAITLCAMSSGGDLYAATSSYDRTSYDKYSGYKTLWYSRTSRTTTVAPAAISSLTASKTSSQPAGTPITWTCNASGGSSRLYKFWVHNGTSWSAAQNYSANNQFTWTPTAAGTYRISVYVDDPATAANPDAFQVSNNFVITAVAPPVVSSLTASKASSQPAGTPITWTCNANSGGSRLYKFWVHNGTSWSAARDYSANNQFTWTPTAAGTYRISVYVDDPATAANPDAFQVSANYVITAGTTTAPAVTSATTTTGSTSTTTTTTTATTVAVPTGSHNVKTYGGAKGDGYTDDTAAINNTINYAYSQGGGTVYIPDGTYLVNPDIGVKLKSNIKLQLATNATIKAKASANSYYDLVLILNATNVEVTGGKIVGDRYIHKGTGGEWGSGISILGSTNVRIADIDISDCWGDGIFIDHSMETTTPFKNYSENVTIERFYLHNNRRQGISVIGAKNLVIRDGEASYINGTRPESGIDLEPDHTWQCLENVLIENVVTKYDAIGILVALPNYNGSTVVSVTIKNCTSVGTPYPISYYQYYESAKCKITVIGDTSGVTSYHD